MGRMPNLGFNLDFASASSKAIVLSLFLFLSNLNNIFLPPASAIGSNISCIASSVQNTTAKRDLVNGLILKGGGEVDTEDLYWLISRTIS